MVSLEELVLTPSILIENNFFFFIFLAKQNTIIGNGLTKFYQQTYVFTVLYRNSIIQLKMYSEINCLKKQTIQLKIQHKCNLIFLFEFIIFLDVLTTKLKIKLLI